VSPMTFAEARDRLAGMGASVRDVSLPDDAPTDLRMGSLRVVASPVGVDILAWDAGMEQLMLRCRTLDEAVEHVEERWRQTPSAVQLVSTSEFAAWVQEMRTRIDSLRPSLEDGGVVDTHLPAGSVVDRFGNLDGFLLYPAQTPMAQRSLPPSVLDPQRPQLGLLTFGVAQPVRVMARRIEPWFGQPGGGVVMRLAEPSDTVRDLVVRGELVQLQISDADQPA